LLLPLTPVHVASSSLGKWPCASACRLPLFFMRQQTPLLWQPTFPSRAFFLRNQSYTISAFPFLRGPQPFPSDDFFCFFFRRKLISPEFHTTLHWVLRRTIPPGFFFFNGRRFFVWLSCAPVLSPYRGPTPDFPPFRTCSGQRAHPRSFCPRLYYSELSLFSPFAHLGHW